ncbi:arsenic efflux protein [Thermophilibacter sp. ET337]|uniref:putative manganese transporter n=1 Tax=Thermophilibacter sp. ET337 TaxID=2973084 RepID=UPI0021ACD9AE|nr:putative manganese transporter [Thermophilibacter sp. ET337]MCR8908408.1 arsenic efflux protein [Thermophilibacter sp. ET337]
MDLLIHVLEHSVEDTLRLVPFLFVTYLTMEALEHASADRVQRVVERSGKAGPVVGALLGAVPQCGFSAMAATLYAGRVLTAGTLVAVILSTSDEMVPVFLAHQEPVGRMLAIMAAKVLVGIVIGFAVDVALRLLRRAGDGHAHIHELCERAHCHCDDEPEGHGHDHGHGRWAVVRSAAVHTVQVSAWILVITFVFGLAMELVGTESLAAAVANHPVRATFLSALVGLIPNCAASVAITELYLEGALAAGPMLAGLLASGGVGLLVLWRTNVDARQSAVITLFVYGIAVVAGLLAGVLGVSF